MAPGACSRDVERLGGQRWALVIFNFPGNLENRCFGEPGYSQAGNKNEFRVESKASSPLGIRGTIRLLWRHDFPMGHKAKKGTVLGRRADRAPRVKPGAIPGAGLCLIFAEKLTSAFPFCFLPVPMLSFSSS